MCSPLEQQLVEVPMPVYESVSAKTEAEMHLHLQSLSHSQRRDTADGEQEIRGTFSPDIIANIRRFGYTPSPLQLQLISEHLFLTIGGVFKLFGFSLESMRRPDFRAQWWKNTHRDFKLYIY